MQAILTAPTHQAANTVAADHLRREEKMKPNVKGRGNAAPFQKSHEISSWSGRPACSS
jgi:hypothetical protein